MNTELHEQPPQSPQPPTVPQPSSPPRSSAAKPIAITAAVVGGVALAAVVGGALFGSAAFGGGAPWASGNDSSRETADAAGVTAVRIDVDAANFTLEFGDVAEAELALDGPRSDRWEMRREGSELRVGSQERFWDFCFGWCRVDAQQAVLTLPRELEGRRLEVDIELAAGEVSTSGTVGELQLDMGAGRAQLAGEARSLDLSVGAGSAGVELADVESASFEISAGAVRGSLMGEAPKRVDLEVSAGTLELELPDETYRIMSEVSAGTLDNGLRMASDAPREITAEISAGRATLTPAR